MSGAPGVGHNNQFISQNIRRQWKLRCALALHISDMILGLGNGPHSQIATGRAFHIIVYNCVKNQ